MRMGRVQIKQHNQILLPVEQLTFVTEVTPQLGHLTVTGLVCPMHICIELAPEFEGK